MLDDQLELKRGEAVTRFIRIKHAIKRHHGLFAAAIVMVSLLFLGLVIQLMVQFCRQHSLCTLFFQHTDKKGELESK